MDRDFVCVWRRHNCRSQVIDLSLSVLISWFMNLIIRFLNNSNLHAIISIALIFNLHWVKKIYFDVLEEKFITMFNNSFNLLQSFNYTPYLFYKKRFKSEINSFYIWTQYWAHIEKKIPFMTRTITTNWLSFNCPNPWLSLGFEIN